MLGMFLIDRGANDVLMLESGIIFRPKQFQMADEITDGSFG